MKTDKKNILAVFISALFLLIIFYNVDFQRLLSTIKLFDYRFILIFVPSYVLTFLLRGLRWQILLDDTKKIPTVKLSEIYILGATLNAYLPARAGDFFRAYHLGKKYNFSKLKIFASVVLERIFDCLTTLILLFAAIFMYHKTIWGIKLATIITIGLTTCIIVLYFMYKYNKTDEICSHLKKASTKFSDKIAVIYCNIIDKINAYLNSFIDGLKALTNIKSIALATILSGIIWSIECALTYLLILSFGYDVSFSVALFSVSFVAFASVIPSSSVFIGPTQYAIILALGIYNIDKSQATAIAFVQPTIMILTISFLALVIFLKNNINDKKALLEEIKEIETSQNKKD